MTNHKDLLIRLRACSEAVEWYDGRDSCEAWRSCQRGDWLLWIAAKLGVDRKVIVSIACDCAETALQFVPEGEDRPRKAIKTAREWIAGQASLNDVWDAAAAAHAAAAAAAHVAHVAVYAADAAGHAAAAHVAVYAADAAAAAHAAVYAADAAAHAAGRTAYAQCAKIVRTQIPWKEVKMLIATHVSLD